MRNLLRIEDEVVVLVIVVDQARARLRRLVSLAEADRDIYKTEFVKLRAKLRNIEPKWKLVRKLKPVQAAVRKARKKKQ